MKSLLKNILLVSWSPLLLVSFSLSAQQKNEEVTIIAPYIPSVGDAAKITFRPEISPGEEEKPSFEYNYLSKKLDSRLELDPIEPLKYSQGGQETLYRNFAKAGLGNYGTPYLDFLAGSLQSEKHLFGVRLKHLSSQGKIRDYPTSAYSNNLISVFGKMFTSTHSLSAKIAYNRDVNHFYGFKPDSLWDIYYDEDDLKQRFQHVQGSLEIGSNYRDEYRLNHRFNAEFHYYSDYYETRESEVSFTAVFNKKLRSTGRDFTHSAGIEVGVEFFNYTDTTRTSNPVYFPLYPVYRLSFGPYRFEAGIRFNLLTGNNAGGEAPGVDVFPVLKAEVVVLENQVKAFAEISGEHTTNSFRDLTGFNPFMISTPELVDTDEQIRVGGGITGNFSGVNFTADAFYSYFNDMPLFVNDTTWGLRNRFDVIYDNMNLLKLSASLGYVKISGLTARLRAAYYLYTPKNEEKAWHLSNFEAGFDAGYTFKEKYTVKVSVLSLGSKYAKTWEEGAVVASKIKGALDLGAGFDYRINRMVLAYVDVNNILNQHYQRWYGYPVQGILVMAGVKISF